MWKELVNKYLRSLQLEQRVKKRKLTGTDFPSSNGLWKVMKLNFFWPIKVMKSVIRSLKDIEVMNVDLWNRLNTPATAE